MSEISLEQVDYTTSFCDRVQIGAVKKVIAGGSLAINGLNLSVDIKKGRHAVSLYTVNWLRARVRLIS